LVLRVLRAGMAGVALIRGVASVHASDPPAYPAGLGVPADVVGDFESGWHDSLLPLAARREIAARVSPPYGALALVRRAGGLVANVTLTTLRPAIRHEVEPQRLAARARSTSATPPSTATETSARRGVKGSASNRLPPNAARIGTLSCTVPACTAVSPRSALYQMA